MRILFYLGMLVLALCMGYLMLSMTSTMAVNNERMVDKQIAQWTNNTSIIKERYSASIGPYELAYAYSNPYMNRNVTVIDKWETTDITTIMLINSQYRIKILGGSEYEVSREIYNRIIVGRSYEVEVNRDYQNIITDNYGWERLQ